MKCCKTMSVLKQCRLQYPGLMIRPVRTVSHRAYAVIARDADGVQVAKSCTVDVISAAALGGRPVNLQFAMFARETRRALALAIAGGPHWFSTVHALRSARTGSAQLCDGTGWPFKAVGAVAAA